MKLGDICNILNGRNQKKVEDINGKYPIYGSGGIMGYANDYICKAGTTIIGRKGSINKPLYVDKDFWNVDTAFGLQPKECCNSRFLYYLCKSIDFTRYDKGVTIPSLVKSDLLQIPVSVPPLSEQARIVEELDQLSNIIEKKRQQLSELDNLAQSIFYDMFGDPITNEKGWEVKRWENILTIVNGKNQLKVECADGKYPIYGSGGIIGRANDYLCPPNTIIIGRKGNINKPLYVNEEFWNVDTAFGLVSDINYIEPQYLYFFCKIYNFEQLNKAVTIPSLTKKDLLQIEMSLPPLLNQHFFAMKIKAIEIGKHFIRQSIIETKNLFDCKMTHYFY